MTIDTLAVPHHTVSGNLIRQHDADAGERTVDVRLHDARETRFARRRPSSPHRGNI